ncbi:uncharacterized protein LOC128237208 [Mya arenaria]|uniref:uncharacterized protein LOC128237208 n=1 Tax=Mya arenaria TaxID=6604 RepID=UPI0022E7DA5A|nr:uncharacterized protein LOC128237208 [Mya arenaria]
MEDGCQKKIWIRLKRKDIGEENCSGVFCVEISFGQSSQEIKEEISSTCSLCDLKNVVYKLRNHRGSLVPLTWNLAANSSSRPYLLEIVRVHQNIKPKPRSITIKSVNDTVKEKLTDIMSRIEKLENASPALKEKRNDKIDMEMKKVEQTLEFLDRRMHDAENVSWKGMFKKNPLW